LLSEGHFLSEIGFALASRILDWTSSAHLSAYSGTATVSALFRKEDARSNESARRDNRSARVLATPKLVRISTAKDRPAGTETITSLLQSINGFGAWLDFFCRTVVVHRPNAIPQFLMANCLEFVMKAASTFDFAGSFE
jgi:hypothetical protein